MNCVVNGESRLIPLYQGQPVDLLGVDPNAPRSIEQWLTAKPATRDRLALALPTASVLVDPIEGYLPPVQNPGKILCVGKNYAEHAREMGSQAPEEPLIFSKLVTSLTGHERSIQLPAASSQVDYEAELVVVIGRPGRHIPIDKAMDHVLGYTCGQDVSARDWQKNKPGGQWLLGKSFDSFGPIGPVLVTADEVADVHQLGIELRLNGEVMQRSNTRNFLFSVPQLIAYVSQVCTLQPGDLLFTGTPEGVGMARRPPVYLRSGDVTEIEIESIGVLRNTFI
jgi:2-keto-4-pentenoate hydratase/2-oxohepta-3-ene-1,7-dioic acid hydratase in catechol pathway